VSAVMGACAECLRSGLGLEHVQSVHASSRREFGLPGTPPRREEGVACALCANRCRLGVGQGGYCGLRENRRDRLHHRAGTPTAGLLSWYYDPLPTNCVADWVCTGSSKSL
jgi:pyruvate formate lyase activating enzyme